MPATIVCGVTDAPECRTAAELAAEASEVLGLGLVLVHAIEVPSEASESLSTRQEQQHAERFVRELAAELHPAEVATRVALGDAAAAIAKVAADEHAALVVLGSRPAGLRKRHLRSRLAERLAATSEVPVFVASPTPRSRAAAQRGIAAVTN